MAGLYDILEKIRAGQKLTEGERDIHGARQVSVLRRLHDELDFAVADAYGWPCGLAVANTGKVRDMLQALVALGQARLAEDGRYTM